MRPGRGAPTAETLTSNVSGCYPLIAHSDLALMTLADELLAINYKLHEMQFPAYPRLLRDYSCVSLQSVT